MLMEAIWPDCIVEENNLTQNISTLRRAFGDSPGAHRYIVTVPGRGYRFVPEVRQWKNGAMPPGSGGPAPTRPPSEGELPSRPSELVAPAKAANLRLIFLAGLLLCAVGVTVFLFRSGRRPAQVTTAGQALIMPEKSIAVLPFENLSADPENAYFADGIKDEILTRLSKVAALKVISSTSTQEYRNSPHNLREIASELGVANVLEGSVQKSGETVASRWSLSTPRRTLIFGRKRPSETDGHLADRDRGRAKDRCCPGSYLDRSGATRARGQADCECRSASGLLKGRYFWNKRNVEGFRKAIGHFTRAIELDPAYAQGYAGLADALLFLAGDNAEGHQEMLAQGRAALQKALEIDETLAEAHASLGLNAVNFDWDWAKGEQEFRRAIELNPNYATGTNGTASSWQAWGGSTRESAR